MPYRIVIDASVARAAGGPKRVHHDSIRCTESLEAFRDTGHFLVMIPPLEKEWGKHSSRYALQWLALMYSRNRVFSPPEWEDPDLRRRVLQAVRDVEPEAVAKVRKDLHLIEAATVSDKRVISLNESERKHFCKAVQTHRKLLLDVGEILWVNPVTEEEQVPQWLREGAPAEPRRRLKEC